MLNILTRNEGLLWGGALCCAAAAHVALVAVFHNPLSPHDTFRSPPMAIMLSLAEMPTRPDIADDADNIALSEPEKPVPPQQDAYEPVPAETLPPAPVEADCPAVRQPESAKRAEARKPERKKPEKTTRSVVHNRKQKAAVRQISAPVSSGFSGAQSSLVSASDGMSAINWLARVQSHLERQKNYLRKKRSARHNGTVQIEFSVSENGAIKTMHLLRSAGSPDLDRLALNVLEHASPLPRPPAGQTEKSIVIPLIFR